MTDNFAALVQEREEFFAEIRERIPALVAARPNAPATSISTKSAITSSS
jgi:hypothetical protein